MEALTGVKQVSIPLVQHIGAPCKPVVSAGDHVVVGQVIGEVESGLGCPVHASVSGTVVGIINHSNAMGQRVDQVVIDSDGLDTEAETIHPAGRILGEMTPQDIIEMVRAAGISGMGGATFPTYAKIASGLGKAKHIIINCAECEPYITVNHRLMLEQPECIIGGTEVLMHAFGLGEAWIAVEDNKMDAVVRLRETLGENSPISVKVVKTKYPQGDERQLIYALTGRELPGGKLPADVGCVIFNAETCAAIYAAFTENRPLTHRRVTVDGDCIRHPRNLLVPIGTEYTELIRACGGLIKQPSRIINGGPMMGFAQWDVRMPVTKGTSAVLFLSADSIKRYDQPSACIHCGRCVRNCPMHLMPNYLAAYAQAGKYDDAARIGVMNCVECGTCSYNCPGQVQIVQYIRVAKGAIRAAQAEARAKAAAAAAEKDDKAVKKEGK